MSGEKIVILLVDDNHDFVRHLEALLQKDEPHKFSVIWKENGEEARRELGNNPDIDVVIMEYFLRGKNGHQMIKELQSTNNRIPVIILTLNKDFDLAVEVMKLGVDEYLVKDEVSSQVLSKTIQKVIEKQRLRDQLMALEITKHRLEAMREMTSKVLKEIAQPIAEMEEQLQQWSFLPATEPLEKYLNIIKENVARIMRKIEQLKSLNTDKTVKYIKDIRMIDLS